MLRASLLTLVLIAGFSLRARGEETRKAEGVGAADVMIPAPASPPSSRYSGSAPIDLSRGVTFTNGTFGQPDPEYEAIANAAPEAPGLTSAHYPYAQKDRFVEIIHGLMDIYREGEDNLKHGTDQRPELVQHRQVLGAALHEKIEAADKALKVASSADESGWDDAQKNARAAFDELQSLLIRKP